jgi:tRNA pseudouridine13 synthase
MHETHLLRGLMAQVARIAREQNSDRVRVVRLKVGPLAHIDPEHLHEHFVTAARGTVAEHARLEIESTDELHDLSLESIDVEVPGTEDIPQPADPSNAPCMLTRDLPGIGGVIRQSPADFEVEEIPAYEPCGDGEHLFLWVEKQGVSAEQLLRHVASTLGISTGAVGCAGLKDRHALTRQYLSVPRDCEARVPAIASDAIRVLSTRRHVNKLRTGHLHGNRFRIVVQGVAPDAAQRAEAIARRLAECGVPNYYGPQRFGHRGDTGVIGMQLLRGEIADPPGPRARWRFLRKLALGAAQAVLFNDYLSARIGDGLFRTVLDGDVMFKLSGGIFYVTDRGAEQRRFDVRETVHAGPLFGKKLFGARGAAAARERPVLDAHRLAPERLRAFGSLLPGGRRANLVYVDDLAFVPLGESMEFRFTLPAGSYATVLLSEFMKDATGPSERFDGGTTPRL